MEIVLLIASYLVGAIPFGFLVGRMAGVDVRQHGSKNIGATNVSRTLGKKLGLLTLVFDVLKGLIPMAAAARILPESPQTVVVVCGCGILAVLGHMFPVYLGFKGGKGVATALGVFLFLSPPAILISLILFVVVVALSGFVSAGSLIVSAVFPLLLYFFGFPAPIIITAVVISVLVWIKHHENIGRLRRGEEKSWKKK